MLVFAWVAVDCFLKVGNVCVCLLIHARVPLSLHKPPKVKELQVGQDCVQIAQSGKIN